RAIRSLDSLEPTSVLRRALLFCSVCLLAALTAACGSDTSAAGANAGGDGGAAPVVTAKVSEKDVPVDIAAIGNVEAYTSISVRAQITGQLQEAFIHEGDYVKKSQTLFE